MQADDEVRVFIGFLNIPDSTSECLPVDFGIGRRDAVVEILSVLYTARFYPQPGVNGSVNRYWCTCLSENPEHRKSPPAWRDMFISPSAYALYGWYSNTPIDDNYNVNIGGTKQFIFHGLTRPFRQLWCVFNGLGDTGDFRLEIYYRAKILPVDVVRALDRQKGALRRT